MFKGRFSKEGTGLVFSDFYKQKLKFYISKNPNKPFELTPVTPESGKQRRYFEGAVVPLIAFYQEGMDHRNYKDHDKVREWLKIEFNSELVNIGGKAHKVAQSTKNKLNQGFLERITDWLQENYQPPMEALNPADWEHWHDTIYPYGGPDNYIDYLLEIKKLK